MTFVEIEFHLLNILWSVFMEAELELATLGGGCFWCLQAIYNKVKGVVKVESGYGGGFIENPDYKKVCQGNTGHAEVVQIQFDTNIINYIQILEIFWNIHDPTTLNRQGNDIGHQYRSIILCHNENQKNLALISRDYFQKFYKDLIVTEIVPFTRFYPAEEYHQNFYKKNPYYSYCIYVIDPKIKKFMESFRHLLK